MLVVVGKYPSTHSNTANPPVDLTLHASALAFQDGLLWDWNFKFRDNPAWRLQMTWASQKGKSFRPNAECQNLKYLIDYSFTLCPLLHTAKSVDWLIQAVYLISSHNARRIGSAVMFTNSVECVSFSNEETCHLSLFTLRDLSCLKEF